MKFEAGRIEKGDVYVIIEKNIEKEIIIESKVSELYYNSILKTVEETTSNLKNVKIILHDENALDWVIRARIESVIRKYEGEGT